MSKNTTTHATQLAQVTGLLEEVSDLVFLSVLTILDESDPASKLVVASVCEVLTSRHPDFVEVLERWSEDLDSELTLRALAVSFLNGKVL